MDTAALSSLTAWLDGVDQLGELLPLLPVLVALELLLSADNAIALAAIAREQRDPRLERRALNLGIAMAFGLRVGLILMAQYVLAFPPIQLIAGGYLLWICFSHWNSSTEEASEGSVETASKPIRFSRTVLTLAITDLAFSIDSVAAAVAISDQLLLVLTGALIGVVALRGALRSRQSVQSGQCNQSDQSDWSDQFQPVPRLLPRLLSGCDSATNETVVPRLPQRLSHNLLLLLLLQKL